MNEQEIRVLLKELGFQKIRKKYGQRFISLISGDKDGMRIWVEVATNEYQINSWVDGKQERTHGKISDLKVEV